MPTRVQPKPRQKRPKNRPADKNKKDGQKPLEDMKNNELKDILKQTGLPVTGNKEVLIERIKMYREGPPLDDNGKPPPAWQGSDAKKKLQRDLLDRTSPIHNMSVGTIWKKTDPRYLLYPNFRKNFKDLKEKLDKEKKRCELDDIKAARHIKNNPRSRLNKRGYPHWNGHPAQKKLQEDVCNKRHEKMKPSQLHLKRKEYQEFPSNIFRVRLNREVDKQRGLQYWAHKRNLEGMKRHLKSIEERAKQN